MIKVVQERENIYTVELDVFELSLIMQIAKGYGIPKNAAIGHCINKGIETAVSILHEIAEHETRKRNSAESEG